MTTCHISFDQFVRDTMSDDAPPFFQISFQKRFCRPGAATDPSPTFFTMKMCERRKSVK